MMKRSRKTAMAMSVAVLTLVLMGTACSDNNNIPSPSSSLTASPSPSASTAPEATEQAVQEGTGFYEGQVDTHSIEIKTDAGPTVFQITPEIGEKVSSWESGESVKYQFTEETIDADGEKLKRLTIIAIDKQ